MCMSPINGIMIYTCQNTLTSVGGPGHTLQHTAHSLARPSVLGQSGLQRKPPGPCSSAENGYAPAHPLLCCT